MLRHRASPLILAGMGIAALAACTANNQSAANRPPAAGAQYASATPAPRPHRELTTDMVKQVQQDLQQQGLYKGNVDGIWGVATQTSLKSYQQSHGLNASGEIDSPTLVALNIPNNAPANNQAQAASAPPPQQPEQQAAPADNQPTDNNNPPAKQPTQDNNGTPPSQ